jgi:hypothetical protein
VRKCRPASLLLLCALLALPSAASAQENAFDFFAGFDQLRRENSGTGLHLRVSMLREPGSDAARPELDQLTFFVPRIRFDPTLPDFCRDPEACPPGSRIGSGTIGVDFGPRGEHVFRGDLFNARGRFLFDPVEAVSPSSEPVQPPPTLALPTMSNAVKRVQSRVRRITRRIRGKRRGFFDRLCPQDRIITVTFDCPPEEQGRLTNLELDIPKQRFRADGRRQDFMLTPPSCPPNDAFRFKADLDLAGEQPNLVGDVFAPCFSGRPPATRCQLITTYIGAVTDNTGRQFTRPQLQVDGSCNRPILGSRVTVEGKEVGSCEDQAGSSCQVSTTFVEDDTAVFSQDLSANEPGSFRVITNPQVERGDRVTVEFLTPGKAVELAEVM